MGKIININIADKRPTVTGTPVIVCGNSDYVIEFTFDTEWDEHQTKTARFSYCRNGRNYYEDVQFTGNTVAVPVLSNVARVLIGVYAGDLCTTTPARVVCERSILCGNSLEGITPEMQKALQAQIGNLADLTTEAKANLVAAINEASRTGGGGGGGAQSDWAASEGQPGHILNRPFYAEIQDVTVLEPITLTALEEMDGMAPIGAPMDVYDGMVCTVTYNGTDYACTATPIADAGLSYWYLGNPSFFGDEGTEGTDLPFGVIAFGPEAAAVMQVPGIAVSFAGDTTFTLGITGIKEVVHPVPKKFMADVRSQKKIILNLDTIESNMPIADTADMDTGEIQAALSVIYKGAEHAVLIVDREETFIEEYGFIYRKIDFLIAHQSSYSGYQLHGVSTCRWDTNGISVKYEKTFAQPFTDQQATVPCLYARMPGESEPQWRRITDTYLDAIVLKSTTAGSYKKFKLTVNDQGELKTTLL